MKKWMLKVFGVSTNLERIIAKTLQITTVMLALLNSNVTLTVTAIIPGCKDEAMIRAVQASLQVFQQQLVNTSTIEGRKKLAGDMGKYITKLLDGRELPEAYYALAFEIVYQKIKGA